MIREKKFVDKPAITGLIDNADLNKKVATLATKAELRTEEDKNNKARNVWFKLKSRGLSDQSIALSLDYIVVRTRVRFNG